MIAVLLITCYTLRHSPDLIFEIPPLSLAAVTAVTAVRAPLAGCNFTPLQPCGKQKRVDELRLSSQTLNMNYCLVLKIKFTVLQISLSLQARNTAV